MKKVSEYFQHGRECRQLATQTADAEYKATLIRMAETWETLGRDRETYVARRKRIDALTKAVRAV